MTVPVVPVDPSPPAFAPRGHPVRWAWLVLVAIALPAAAATSTGAVGPAIDLRWDTFAAREDRAARTHQLALVVRNTRRLPITVTAVEAEANGLEVVRVETGRGASQVPRNPIGRREVLDPQAFAPFELAHDEERYVVITVRVTDCAAIPANAPQPWVRVRSRLGVERTEHLDGDYRAPTPTGPYDFRDGYGEGWAHSLTRAMCGR